MRKRVTVSSILCAEIMAFYGTGEAFTDRGANDIDLLAYFEEIDLDLLTCFEPPLFGLLISTEAKFSY